ncbi:hypothetical protein MASR2M78_07250 [Treponema sp.]
MRPLKQYKLGVYFILLCIGFSLLYGTAAFGLLNRQQEDRNRNLTFYAQEIARSLANQIEPAFGTAYSFGALVEQGSSPETLNTLAHRITERWPMIAWVVLAPDGIVSYILPKGVASASIGLDLLSDPVRSPDARRAVEMRTPILSGPYRLMEGPMGFTIRFPVFISAKGTKEDFWGFAVSVVTLDTFLELSGLREIEKNGYRWALSSKKRTNIHNLMALEPSPAAGDKPNFFVHDVFAASLEGLPINPISVDVPLPNSPWVFSLSSADLQAMEMEQPFFLLTSILLAILSAGFITAYIARSRASRHLAKENELLLREIHHRIKNNLAIVESMISLTASEAGAHQFAEKFDDLSRRIHSISLIHEKLYSEKKLDRLDGPSYILDLCRFIASGISPSLALPEIKVAPISLNIKAALPIGLILTELFTNAVKYGSDGYIGVSLVLKDKDLILSVENEGPPPPEDYKNQDGLGLRLVDSLVEQLQGDWYAEAGPPVRFSVVFPANAAIFNHNFPDSR